MWVAILCGLLHTLMHLTSAQDRCTTPNSQEGKCIKLDTCHALVHMLNELQFIRNSICGFDNLDPKVCCPVNIEEERRKANESRSGYPNFLIPPQCGFTHGSDTRMVGGLPVELGAYPWIVALGYYNYHNSNKPKFLCGGVLISDKHILTAGHCVYNRTDLYLVRLGDVDLSRDDDGAPSIDRFVAKRAVHPDYSTSLHVNDIAVLTVHQKVEFTDSIRPICLPAAPTIRYRDLTSRPNTAGVLPFIAGWGRLGEHKPTSNTLTGAQVPIVSIESCKKSYKGVPKSVIDDSVLCAGYTMGGTDACQGDSGGPLMLPEGKTFYVVGVVSYGFKCAEPGYPGVYTKVTMFLDFISEAMRENP